MRCAWLCVVLKNGTGSATDATDTGYGITNQDLRLAKRLALATCATGGRIGMAGDAARYLYCCATLHLVLLRRVQC